MKLKSFILIPGIALCFTHTHAQFVEDATKYAALVPATGITCGQGTKPCAILNKSADRPIVVKIEESVAFNDILTKKILIFDNIAPNEKRYIGCAGRTREGDNIKGFGYKIVLASFAEADSIRVRRLLNDVNDNDTVIFSNDTHE